MNDLSYSLNHLNHSLAEPLKSFTEPLKLFIELLAPWTEPLQLLAKAVQSLTWMRPVFFELSLHIVTGHNRCYLAEGKRLSRTSGQVIRGHK